MTFDKGEYRVAGTDRAISIRTLIEKQWGEAAHPLDTNVTIDLATAFPSGAHVAEVEIDPDTGASSSSITSPPTIAARSTITSSSKASCTAG